MAWLASAIMGTEVLINIKFGSGLYTAPTPQYIVYSWAIGLSALVIWFVVYFGFYRTSSKPKLVRKPSHTKLTAQQKPVVSD
jgi:hypothetical protein